MGLKDHKKKNHSTLEAQLRRELAKIMEEKNLSKLTIAEKTGISYSTLHRTIEGKSLPSLSKIEALADALDMDVVISFKPRHTEEEGK